VRRREIAAWYDELLGTVPDVSVPVEPADFYHVYHLYVIRHPKRDQLKRYLTDRGIGTDVHYPRPMAKQPVFSQFRNGDSGVAETEKAVGEILSLPMYPTLSQQQVETVCTAIREFKS
jgi:dTDP-4-amino-4,6-dideoxygalactose transaminase